MYNSFFQFFEIFQRFFLIFSNSRKTNFSYSIVVSSNVVRVDFEQAKVHLFHLESRLILVIEMQTVVQLPFHIRQRWREVWRKVARGLFAYQDCIVLKVVVVHQLNEKNIKISQWINLLALVACSNIPLMLWYCQTLGETGGQAGHTPLHNIIFSSTKNTYFSVKSISWKFSWKWFHEKINYKEHQDHKLACF